MCFILLLLSLPSTGHQLWKPFLKLTLLLLPQLQAYRHMNPCPVFSILSSSFLLVSFLLLLLYLFIYEINKLSQGLECTRQTLKQVLKTIEERKHRRQVRRGKKGKKEEGMGKEKEGKGGKGDGRGEKRRGGEG